MADIEILQTDPEADTLSGTAPHFSYVTAIVENDEDFYQVRVQADDVGRGWQIFQLKWRICAIAGYSCQMWTVTKRKPILK